MKEYEEVINLIAGRMFAARREKMDYRRGLEGANLVAFIFEKTLDEVNTDCEIRFTDMIDEATGWK